MKDEKCYKEVCNNIEKILKENISALGSFRFCFEPELYGRSDEYYDITYFSGKICFSCNNVNKEGSIAAYNPIKIKNDIYHIIDCACSKYRIAIKERDHFFSNGEWDYRINFIIYYDIKEK